MALAFMFDDICLLITPLIILPKNQKVVLDFPSHECTAALHPYLGTLIEITLQNLRLLPLTYVNLEWLSRSLAHGFIPLRKALSAYYLLILVQFSYLLSFIR